MRPASVHEAKFAAPTENFAAQIGKFFHLNALKPLYSVELERRAAFLKHSY